MKYLILITLLLLQINCDVIIDLKFKCQCHVFKLQKDCLDSGCFFVGNSCREFICSDFVLEQKCLNQSKCYWSNDSCLTYKSCDQINDSKTCYKASSSNLECAWNNNNQCSQFNNTCSYYQPIDQQCPQNQQIKCLISNEDNKKCQDSRLHSCSDYYSDTLCNSRVNCIFINDKCLDFTSCQTANGSESLCPITKKCTWSEKNQLCNNKECKDFTNQDDCNYVELFNGTLLLCQWDDTDKLCLTASDVSFLTNYDCRSTTFTTYQWNGAECQSCTTFALIQTFLILILIILI